MTEEWGVSARGVGSERLDLTLMKPPFNLSRRGAKRELDAGNVVIEGTSVAVASRKIGPETRVALIPRDVSLPLIDRGDDFVVIDKPAALASQIPADRDAVSAHEILVAQLRRDGERRPVKIVHRLDTNTTGAMAFAIGDGAARRLAGKLQGRRSTKLYLAIVDGRIERPQIIDAPIDRAGSREFGVDEEGKEARTRIRPLDSRDGHTLVEAELLTGRTHQIRIHLAHIGHPILGDRKYGLHVAERGPRPMLHAWHLSIEGEGEWQSTLPADFRETMERLDLRWSQG